MLGPRGGEIQRRAPCVVLAVGDGERAVTFVSCASHRRGDEAFEEAGDAGKAARSVFFCLSGGE